MYTIGEFSRITGLTVKTLRFYHDEGIVVPGHVDPSSNYRYYNDDDLERARVAAYLRGLEVPIQEVKEILRAAEDSHLTDVLERHKQAIEDRMKHYRKVIRSLDSFVERERKIRL